MHIRVRRWVKVALIIILLCISFFVYSRFIETKKYIVKEYNVIDSNIPSNLYGLKIVHLSDIHYNVTTDKDDLKKIIDDVNLLKPDIVIISGDIFDSSIKYTKQDIKDLTNLLSKISYSIGKYAIKGENDLKIKYWDELIKNSDFIDLNDNYNLIYNSGYDPILLVGISSNYYDNHIKKTIDEIYSKIKEEYKYSVLVLHEPDFINKIDYNKFNLILAGHSHNGQIVLPFFKNVIKNKYSTTYYDNYYKLKNTSLYISSGIGTSKVKLRFLNKPSFNLYRLRNK